MLKKLWEPFPPSAPLTLLKSGFYIGLFVFLFLFFFRPFGLASEAENIFQICIGYGMVTFFIMFLSAVFHHFFHFQETMENNWTFGKELLSSILHLLIIGIGNAGFTIWMFELKPDIMFYVYFQIYTLGIGIFPVTLILYKRSNQLLKLNQIEAYAINYNLDEKYNHKQNTGHKLQIPSELKNDDLQLLLDEFIAASCQDNYLLIYHLKDGQLAKSTIRNSIANLYEYFKPYKRVVRPHRSFLINLAHVKDFSGNAAGLKLNVNYLNFDVPVSRSNVGKIKAALQ